MGLRLTATECYRPSDTSEHTFLPRILCQECNPEKEVGDTGNSVAYSPKSITPVCP